MFFSNQCFKINSWISLNFNTILWLFFASVLSPFLHPSFLFTALTFSFLDPSSPLCFHCLLLLLPPTFLTYSFILPSIQGSGSHSGGWHQWVLSSVSGVPLQGVCDRRQNLWQHFAGILAVALITCCYLRSSPNIFFWVVNFRRCKYLAHLHAVSYLWCNWDSRFTWQTKQHENEKKQSILLLCR